MPGTLQIVSQYGVRALHLLQWKYNFRSVVAGVTINRLRSLYWWTIARFGPAVFSKIFLKSNVKKLNFEKFLKNFWKKFKNAYIGEQSYVLAEISSFWLGLLYPDWCKIDWGTCFHMGIYLYFWWVTSIGYKIDWKVMYSVMWVHLFEFTTLIYRLICPYKGIKWRI